MVLGSAHGPCTCCVHALDPLLGEFWTLRLKIRQAELKETKKLVYVYLEVGPTSLALWLSPWIPRLAPLLSYRSSPGPVSILMSP